MNNETKFSPSGNVPKNGYSLAFEKAFIDRIGTFALENIHVQMISHKNLVLRYYKRLRDNHQFNRVECNELRAYVKEKYAPYFIGEKL